MFFIPERSQTKHDHASHLVLEPPSRCHKIDGTVTHKFLAITILEGGGGKAGGSCRYFLRFHGILDAALKRGPPICGSPAYIFGVVVFSEDACASHRFASTCPKPNSQTVPAETKNNISNGKPATPNLTSSAQILRSRFN